MVGPVLLLKNSMRKVEDAHDIEIGGTITGMELMPAGPMTGFDRRTDNYGILDDVETLRVHVAREMHWRSSRRTMVA